MCAAWWALIMPGHHPACDSAAGVAHASYLVTVDHAPLQVTDGIPSHPG